MSAHTPGPWPTDAWGVSEMGECAIIWNAPNGVRSWNIATVHDKRNARLIAAAPELLAGLRDVMPLLAECDCIYSDRADKLCPCKAARAALAKVES